MAVNELLIRKTIGGQNASAKTREELVKELKAIDVQVRARFGVSEKKIRVCGRGKKLLAKGKIDVTNPEQ